MKCGAAYDRAVRTGPWGFRNSPRGPGDRRQDAADPGLRAHRPRGGAPRRRLRHADPGSEKPVDLTLERTVAARAEVEKAKVAFMVGFQRRWDPTFRAVKKAITQGTIGNVEMVRITSRDPSPPPPSYVATSSGIFRDMMIHDFDMARWLLGEEPNEVYATGSAIIDPEIGKAGDFDTLMVILQTATGRQCHINNSRHCVYGYDQRVEVFGAEGMLLNDNTRRSISSTSRRPTSSTSRSHWRRSRRASRSIAKSRWRPAPPKPRRWSTRPRPLACGPRRVQLPQEPDGGAGARDRGRRAKSATSCGSAAFTTKTTWPTRRRPGAGVSIAPKVTAPSPTSAATSRRLPATSWVRSRLCARSRRRW